MSQVAKLPREAMAIVRKIGTAIMTIQAARLDIGRLWIEMTALKGVTKQAASDTLRATYPGAKDTLGYELTVRNLNALGTAYDTFVKDGGVKRGHHAINGDDIAHLKLTPTELEKVATAVTAGDIKIKSLRKQIAKVAKDDGKLAEAQKVVRDWVAEPTVPAEPEPEPAEPTTAELIAEKQAEIARLHEQLRVAETELAELQLTLQAEQAEQGAGVPAESLN